MNKPQKPYNPNNWLYQDQKDGLRIFAKQVYLGIHATPWPECTNEEKEQWEQEHTPSVLEPESI